MLLFIDQEHGDIKTTLHNIRMLLNDGHPSLTWTGRGYHIYLPMLLKNSIFANNEELTFQFLRYIERKVTSFKNDKGHSPGLRSSMMRIPYTINAKALEEDRPNFEVSILQRWDGHRVVPSNEIFEEFKAIKNRVEIKELKQEIVFTKEANKIKAKYEKLAQDIPKDPVKEFLIFQSKGISDGRRNMLYYVISRYLIREKYETPQAVEAMCHDWLRRCDKVNKLRYTSHYLKYHVKHCIQDSIHRNRDSMPVEVLKTYSVEAYNQLIAEYEDYKSRPLEVPNKQKEVDRVRTR